MAYDAADILRYTPAGQWQLFFDGSDVGLGVAGIKAFTLLSDNSILLSVAKPVEMAGLGRIGLEDVLRFIPTSTGTTTAGTFQLYFDGSDVSLTAKSEAIDALTIGPGGKLIISTTGKVTIKPPSGNLKARNSDLLAFTFGTTGSSTSGTWSLYFEGADVGLKKENVDALWIDPLNGDIYLSVTNAYNLGNGVSGDESAIFICDPGSLGATTTCAYRAYWDAAAAGLDANIRGIYIQR